MKVVLKIVGFFLNVLGFFIPRIAGRWAAKLFCYPVRSSFKPRHKSFLNDAKWRTMAFKKEKIVLYKWGNGPKTMLMAHGWQSHSYRWKRYLAEFDQTAYTYIAFDAPGHGMSSGHFFNVPEYGQLLQKIFDELETIDVLLGHSIGAFSSLYAIAELGIKPKRLVLLASPGDAMDFMKVYRSMFGFNQTIEDNIQAYIRSLYGVDLRDFKGVEFAEKIDIPGLIIHDLFDPDCDVEYAKAIHAKWEKSKLVLTKGKGHHVIDKKSIKEVVDFIRNYPKQILNKSRDKRQNSNQD